MSDRPSSAAPQPVGDELSPVKRALIEIRELRARLSEARQAASEPVAVIGVGIRTPGGVVDLAGFERLLWSGTDAVGPIPPDRWRLEDWYDADRDAPGKMTTRFGGFLDDVSGFDAAFFGIAPVEADSMDPQQRLVLELAWEALEDAGIAPSSLGGSATGVYLGIANGDYGRALFSRPERIDPYFSPGNAYSVASGRVAYLLGLHGPAISVDTACSSSLVALHLACQGLRGRDCDLALVGGVNLVLTPEMNVNFSKAGMMAADGRCKTFDAGADGYVRGEGGAVIVLRRLGDAIAAGDDILAVVRGTAINQDGRSQGLTAPNGPAQEAVLRSALRAADVAAAQVAYVEAHGTGTPLGDPIEVNALAAVLGEGRASARPLAIGSVKTNIGHLEAAAGIVGLVKAMLVLRRAEVPPHLHLATPNPHVDWSSMPLTVPTAVTPLAPIDDRLVAGVSSFGFSGTNAHAILEAPPVRPPAADGDAAGCRPMLLALSARGPEALRSLAVRYRDAISALDPEDTGTLADLCHTAAVGRAAWPHRLSVAAPTGEAIADALDRYAQGRPAAGRVDGVAMPGGPRVAFLFPGQGPQHVGMARRLACTEPVFAQALRDCAAALDPMLPRPLLDVIDGRGDAGALLDETAFAQPAMFAIEVALAALWRAWGVEPIAVMGHSFGEYAAACVAGALSLEDAATMVATRGRLVQDLPREGSMVVIEAGEHEVAEAIAPLRARVSIAAVNGPRATVISGASDAVREVARRFEDRGARTKALRVSHAFHSPLIEPVLDAFERAVSGVAFREPGVPLVSTLTGRVEGLSTLGAPGYWRRHMRETVRFAEAVRTLAARGVTHCVELGPQPVLLGMGAECVDAMEWVASLREGRDDREQMIEGLQVLHRDGLRLDRARVHGRAARRLRGVPSYPFERRRHWIDAGAPPAATGGDAKDRWRTLAATLERESARAPIDVDVRAYAGHWQALAELTRRHAVRTLSRAGLFSKAGESHDLDEVLARTGVRPTYRHLLQRWLADLAGCGWLRAEAGRFVADRPLPPDGLEQAWVEVGRRLEDNRPLLDYLRHCGSLLEDVLAGRESPLESLFPEGRFDLAESLYRDSSMMRYVNQLAGAAVERIAADAPRDRPLRVLEIGGGTGGTTASILAALAPYAARYRFTDVSDVFLARARERTGHLGWVEYALFDLERDPAGQGIPDASLDLVVAANAVHAVKDLRAALERLRRMLAPGGTVLLVESTEHLAYFDMTTGLIEGWQHFADDLRGDHPLLAPHRWREALVEAGFEAVGTWPGDGTAAGVLGQHLVVARVAGRAEDAAAVPGSSGEARTADAGPGAPAAAATVDWRARLAESTDAERSDLLRDAVRAEVVRILRLDPDAPPDAQARLMALGMDSLMAVQLRNALVRTLPLRGTLRPTLIFDHPTIAAIATHLLERLDLPDAAPAGSVGAGPVGDPRPEQAVIGRGAIAAMSDEEIARLLDDRMGPP